MSVYKQLHRIFIQHHQETYTGNFSGYSFNTIMKPLQATSVAIHWTPSWNLYIATFVAIHWTPSWNLYIATSVAIHWALSWSQCKQLQMLFKSILSTLSWSQDKQSKEYVYIQHFHEVYTTGNILLTTPSCTYALKYKGDILDIYLQYILVKLYIIYMHYII